ncbi:MAG: hypothetical protein WCS56_04905 [Bacilli bacterium]
MIIPTSEKILYSSHNVEKKWGYLLFSCLLSLQSLVIVGIFYIFAYKIIGILWIIIIAIIVYIIVTIITYFKGYNRYMRYFGTDELSLSETKIYYNVCMLQKGEYINFDGVKDYKNVREVFIKRGIRSDQLVIYFVDDTHITIHCLGELPKIKLLIDKRLNILEKNA